MPFRRILVLSFEIAPLKSKMAINQIRRFSVNHYRHVPKFSFKIVDSNLILGLDPFKSLINHTCKKDLTKHNLDEAIQRTLNSWNV